MSHSRKAVHVVDAVLFLTILGLMTDVIDLGIPLIEAMLIVIVFAMMLVFGRFTLRVDEMHEAAATRPRFGTIHHADGTKTQVRFIETEEGSTFAVLTFDGGRALMYQGDRLETDHEHPQHEFLFANSPR